MNRAPRAIACVLVAAVACSSSNPSGDDEGAGTLHGADTISWDGQTTVDTGPTGKNDEVNQDHQEAHYSDTITVAALTVNQPGATAAEHATGDLDPKNPPAQISGSQPIQGQSPEGVPYTGAVKWTLQRGS